MYFFSLWIDCESSAAAQAVAQHFEGHRLAATRTPKEYQPPVTLVDLLADPAISPRTRVAVTAEIAGWQEAADADLVAWMAAGDVFEVHAYVSSSQVSVDVRYGHASEGSAGERAIMLELGRGLLEHLARYDGPPFRYAMLGVEVDGAVEWDELLADPRDSARMLAVVSSAVLELLWEHLDVQDRAQFVALDAATVQLPVRMFPTDRGDAEVVDTPTAPQDPPSDAAYYCRLYTLGG